MPHEAWPVSGMRRDLRLVWAGLVLGFLGLVAWLIFPVIGVPGTGGTTTVILGPFLVTLGLIVSGVGAMFVSRATENLGEPESATVPSKSGN